MAAAPAGASNEVNIFSIPKTGCPDIVREDWVPPENRNEALMKENLGPDSAHSFIYFPKSVISTSDGTPLYVMNVPEGALFFRGETNDCEQVNNPNSPDCKECLEHQWYADFNTARTYAPTNDNIYAFITKKPLVLLNFLDVRNVEVMIKILITKLEEFEGQGFNFQQPPARPGTPPPGQKPKENTPMEKEVKQIKEYIECLLKTTCYQLDESILERFWYPTETYGVLCDSRRTRNTNPPNTNPEDLMHVTDEFGDQSALVRTSQWWHDRHILSVLQFCFPELLDGYYAPRYVSRMHDNGRYCPEKRLYMFHREMAVYATKGRLSRVPSHPLNGCTRQKAGRQKRTVRNRKRHHKKQRRTKSKRSSS